MSPLDGALARVVLADNNRGVAAWPGDSALIAQAPDAIIVADRAGVVRVWNRAAEALFGYRGEEAIGQTLDLIVPEADRPAHWAGFTRAIERGRFASDAALQTSRTVTKDGRPIVVELSAAILLDPAGHPQGIMAIGRDVTERWARDEAQRARRGAGAAAGGGAQRRRGPGSSPR